MLCGAKPQVREGVNWHAVLEDNQVVSIPRKVQIPLVQISLPGKHLQVYTELHRKVKSLDWSLISGKQRK